MFYFCRAVPRLLAAVFLSLVLFLTGREAKAQMVVFPDPALEAALRNALGIFAPTNIYRTNLASATFTNFTADGAGIYDLTGIE
jgi:hypothetical protein